MRIRIVLLISAAILLFDIAAIANSDKKTSIALITDKASGLDKSPLVSLLEAELSQKEGIRLLERASIDKILQEQQLSATGLLDRNTAIKIGKLLQADAFIILSVESQTKDANDLIRVRVSQTAHGLRLLDYFEQLDSKNPKDTVERIIKKLEVVLKKINQPDEKLIPVGIVDIHRIQLGEQYKMLERTLPVMLSVRLSLEPQIIMLEREDLKVLLDEKLRTEGEDTKFWNSAILIEGYIQPNNGVLTMTFSLRRPGGDGTKSFTVPVEPNEPATAIAKATTDIIQQLQNSPPTSKWQPELEAEQFYKQGQLLSAHSRYDDAIPLYETAHSLQLDNVYYTGNLFDIYWYMRRTIERIKSSNSFSSKPVPYPWVCQFSDMELAELAYVLIRQIQNEFQNGKLSNREVLSFAPYLGNSAESANGYFLSSVSVITEEVRLLNRENRKIWIELVEMAIRKQSPVLRPSSNRDIASLTWLSTDEPFVLIDNLKKALKKFVFPPELGGEIQSPKDRDYIFKEAFKYRFDRATGERSHLKDNYLVTQKLWKEYLTEMVKINDPVVQLNSCIFLSSITEDANNLEKEEAKYYINESLKIISQKINNPEETMNYYMESILNEIKNKTGNITLTKNEIVKIWSDFYEPFIAKKDVAALTLCSPGFGSPNTRMSSNGPEFIILEDNKVVLIEWKEATKQWYQLLGRIAEVLDTDSKNTKVINALNEIRNRQAEFRRQFPYLFVQQKKPNIKITKLMTTRSSTERLLLSLNLLTEIQNDMLWIATESHSRSIDNQGKRDWKFNISLAGINLEQKKLKALWQTALSLPVSPRFTDLVINKNACYLSIIDIGILEFPGSAIEGQEQIKNPTIFTEKTGLPSNSITSIVQDGDKLWVAYGYQNKESGLGLFNPNTKQWDTVFCSILEGEPPFNSSYPYQLQNLTIPQPGILFFILSEQISDGTTSKYLKEWKGLWAVDTINRTKQYICPIFNVSENINASEGKLLIDSGTATMEYDINSKKMKVVNGNLQQILKLFSEHGLTAPDFNNDLLNPEKTKVMSFDLNDINGIGLRAIHNNTLWARMGASQIIILEKGKSFEDATILDNNILDGKPVEMFISTPYGLIGIGEGIVGLIETENMEK